ncbi:MAG: restriction endonuclease [Thaumarchaeota archaeon]|nr:restriction endonuclease [Nitrososphaerota archaeon]
MDSQDPLYRRLVTKARGESRAEALVEELSLQLGLPRGGNADRVIAAVALIKTGVPPETVGAFLTWVEFETFCGGLLEANGYAVKRNVVITKPRRQIDIVARSPDLSLSVDCKHWGKSFSDSTLERIVRSQIERTSHYKKKLGLREGILPAVFTMLDAPTRVVLGVPVVPVFAMRDFLNNVSRFDENLRVL